MLTEQIRPFRFALVAFAPVRLSALNYKKTSADISGSLFAIVDERINSECEEGLINEGFEIIKLPKDKRLSEAVSSHTDLLIFRHHNDFIVSKKYYNDNKNIFDLLKSKIPGLNIIFTDEAVLDKYPFDAILNALVISDKIFIKSDTASKTILEYAKEKKLKIVPIKQGYPACTVLAIGEKLAITSDVGMEKILRAEAINVHRIDNSEKIKLHPYKYGFIGGCASVFEKKIYFLGNLDAIDEGDILKSKISELGYTTVSLAPESNSLFDLGGMILIRA